MRNMQTKNSGFTHPKSKNRAKTRETETRNEKLQPESQLFCLKF